MIYEEIEIGLGIVRIQEGGLLEECLSQPNRFHALLQSLLASFVPHRNRDYQLSNLQLVIRVACGKDAYKSPKVSAISDGEKVFREGLLLDSTHMQEAGYANGFDCIYIASPGAIYRVIIAEINKAFGVSI